MLSANPFFEISVVRAVQQENALLYITAEESWESEIVIEGVRKQGSA